MLFKRSRLATRRYPVVCRLGGRAGRRAGTPPATRPLGAWGTGTLGGVGLLYLAGVQPWAPFVKDTRTWRTFLFTTLVFSQMALALCVRSESNPLFRLRLRANLSLLLALLATVALQLAVVYAPPLQRLFETQPLTLRQLAGVVGITVGVFAIAEVLDTLPVRRTQTKLRGALKGPGVQR